jgi:Protein of unknown function (DUF3500)
VAGGIQQASAEGPNVVAAANAFLATLSDTQRGAVMFDYPIGQTTATAAQFTGSNGNNFVGEQFGASVWSNYPISDVPRPGLRMGDLSDSQRAAVMTLLSATLSQRGYQEVQNIMGGDQALADSGTNFASGTDNYVVSIHGTPSASQRWMWQFGGHHLALNATIQGTTVVDVPMLTGCQPCSYTSSQGLTIQPLQAELDSGFQLVNALDASQQQQAILSYAVTDLVLGPGHDGQVLAPEGIPASSLTADQQGMLLNVIGGWVDIMADPATSQRMDQIKADLAQTYFAWSGSTTPGSVVYFRVTGPTVHIEFSHQGSGGGGPGGTGVQAGGVNHVHTVYRDPTNDYGRGLAQ